MYPYVFITVILVVTIASATADTTSITRKLMQNANATTSLTPDRPLLCASCAFADYCSGSPCSNLAELTCQVYHCTYPITLENGTTTTPNICTGSFFNNQSRMVPACRAEPATTSKGPCPTTWDPVCASGDSTTYATSCHAEAAGQLKYTSGLCPLSAGNSTTNTTPCPTAWAPVCDPASNLTYSNNCTAVAANATTFRAGTCATGISTDSVICPTVYDPVCDSATSKTYPNSCQASTAKVPTFQLRPGACVDAAQQSPMPPMVACPAIWRPVCSKGNQTYGNECAARAAGVNFTTGACKKASGAGQVRGAVSLLAAVLAAAAAAALGVAAI